MRRPTEPSERLQRILERHDATPAPQDDPAPLPSVLTVPGQLATARWGVSRRAVLGVALVLLLALVVLGARLGLAARAAEPVPVGPEVTASGDRSGFGDPGQADPPGAAGAASPTPPAGSSLPAGSPLPAGSSSPDGSPTPAAASSGTLLVHVVGSVRRPGVARLPAGARVADAVEKAGGAAGGADLAQVNLARPLVDGEQVVVPREGESIPAPPTVPGPGSVAGPAAATGPAATAGPGPINLNTADQATLETLPGVGPVLAERIIEWRTTNGRFTTVEELNEVSGIGEKLYAQISPEVVV